MYEARTGMMKRLIKPIQLQPENHLLKKEPDLHSEDPAYQLIKVILFF